MTDEKELKRRIRKAHKILDKYWKIEDQKPQISERDLLGTNLTVEVYGYCQWSKIRYLKDKKEVYRLAKCGYGTDVKREEFFFDEKFREYKGNQFCFVEYCALVKELGLIPPSDMLAEVSRVKKNILDGYKRFAEKIAINADSLPKTF